MDGFCGSTSFWDTELTWTNNSWPQFTECFQNTVLQWVPCGWLWISAPFYIYSLAGCQKKPQPGKYLFLSKQFCSLALLLVFILDIVEAFNETKSHDFDAELLAPIIWIVTLVLHIVLVWMERSRDVIRSLVMFMFWTLAGICTLVPFYSSFMLKMYDSNLFKFALLCIKYLAIVVLIFINCFAEYYGEKTKDHNPEISASVLSWFTFSFVDRTVLQGFKSPLLSNDIYNMLPVDTTEKVITKFLSFWDQEHNKLSHRVKDQQIDSASSSSEETVNEKTPLLVSWKKSSAVVTVRDSKQEQAAPDGNHDHTSIEINKNKKTKVSFFKALIKCYWLEGISSNWGMLTYVATSVVSPFVLGWLIDFTSNTSEWTWHGYIYTLAFIAAKVLYISFGVMSKYLTNRLALRLNTTGIGTVFRKALTVSGEARKESTLGEIVNLMSVDSGHVEMMINYSYWMWMSIIFLVLGIYLLYTIIGIALLSGMAVVIIMFAVNFWVMHKMREYQDQIMVIKDERVKIVNEALNGIKVIKLYGWEPMFISKITEVRERELKILFKYAVLDAVESFAWLAAMFWMMHLMLVTFVMIDDNHYLDANTSFRTMNYIDVISLAINIMPIIVKDWIKAANSIGRLNKFLNSEDLDLTNLYRDKSDKLALRVVHADFAWESSGPCTLKDITLSIEPGQFVAIVGTVGAGKSSLLSAVLGDMHKRSGYFNLNSSVAYVPQQAWIQNNTVRENILFGQSFNEDHYHEVVRACALQPDLDMMPAGDNTEIGEKGINMSGGQKQRVSLARAVYSGADIYLLDDPLSAVDSHVGKHIFDQVLSKDGLLYGKTRIMVTHGVQWLPHVDYIVVMSNGTVSEAGTFEKLMDHNGAFAQFLTQYLRQEDNTISDKVADDNLDKEVKEDILRRLVSVTSDSEPAFSRETSGLHGLVSKDGTTALFHELSAADRRLSQSHSVSRHRPVREMSSRLEVSQRSEIRENAQVVPFVDEKEEVDRSRLTTEEEAALGKVKWSMYWELVKGVGIGHSFLIVILFACYHIAYNVTNVWLTNWNDDASLSNFTSMPEDSQARKDRNVYYIGIYTALGVAQTLFVIGYSVDLQIRHVQTARKLHAELLYCIMRAPMSFFDTTPIGRILNRFSQDIEVLDNDVFIEAEIAMDKAFRCLGTVIIISYTMPIFIAVVVPVIIILYVIQQFYIRTSCQLRRVASTNKSPVYAHFSETLSGVSVIRAYQAQDRFVADSQRKVDNFQKANYVARAVNKWLEIRLEILSYIIVAAAGIFAVISRGDMSPGLVGLAVTYALRVSGEMNIFTIVFGDLETHIVSIERIREFSVVSSEASWTSSVDDQVVREDWPSRGEIQFMSYSTRYREGLDLVLKGLDCTIQGGEKVGIVGRTGAGKSSMVLSLFRLIEAAGGKVIIDGIDVSNIGLHALRRKLTILPQDPVLFAGSLRMNLDPFFEKSDPELWAALEHSHLKAFVDTLPNKLEHEVGEGGENLSMGQRQLVCLARTLLRKTKILILDEATAAVDMETDDLIQKTIRSEFSGCTILTIAHRLNTVMDYDRILVLDGGLVAEFDSPKNLLANPNSIFFSMASQAGLVSPEPTA